MVGKWLFAGPLTSDRLVWYMVWYVVWCGKVYYGMVRNGMVRNGMVNGEWWECIYGSVAREEAGNRPE